MVRMDACSFCLPKNSQWRDVTLAIVENGKIFITSSRRCGQCGALTVEYFEVNLKGGDWYVW